MIVEILDQDEALGHVVVHQGLAHRLLFLFHLLALMLVYGHVGAGNACGKLVVRDAGVHGTRFDRLDQALHGQRHHVGAVAKATGASRIAFMIGCIRSMASERA